MISTAKVKANGSIANIIDARAKLVAAVITAVSAVTLPTGPGLWLVGGVVLGAIILSGADTKRLGAPLLLLGWMFILTVLIHGFTTSGRVVWEAPVVGWTLTAEGLERGLLLSLRLVLAVLAAGLALVSSDSLDVIAALERLCEPLRRVGLNPGRFFFTLVLALRFVPSLFEEAVTLKKALTARGWNSGRKWTGRLTAWLPILLPLLVNALRRSDELAEALVMRGYDPRRRRTSLYSRNWAWRDTLLVVFTLIPLAGWILFDFA